MLGIQLGADSGCYVSLRCFVESEGGDNVTPNAIKP